MHPADCSCDDCANAVPLTFDESLRLAALLGERGHGRAAYEVLTRVIYDAMMAQLQGAA
jgi:hypothetical protein